MTSTLVGQLVTLQIIFEDCKNKTKHVQKKLKDTITPHGEEGCCDWGILRYIWYCRSWHWKIPKFHWPSSRELKLSKMQRSFAAADDCLYSFKKRILWNMDCVKSKAARRNEIRFSEYDSKPSIKREKKEEFFYK